jgi:predicted negative regulator of RcsB-dependent stress response
VNAGELERLRVACEQLYGALRALDVARGQLRRGELELAQRALQHGVSSALHAAAIVAFVVAELERRIDPWHGAGSPWASLRS